MIMKKTKRNILLDYVRGLACIFVILYHYTHRYVELYCDADNWIFKVPWGYMAVSTFFMLSGYLAIEKDESSTGLWAYIKKKAVRLYPVYWVAILITFVVTFFWLPDRKVSIRTALFNFTMLESFVGVRLVDGAYWTLANELVFYAFVALVVIVLKMREKLPWFCLGWVVILFIFHYIKNDTLISVAMGKLIAKQYGHMFVVGTSLVFVLHDSCDVKIKCISCISIVVAIVYQYLTFDLWYTLYFLISLCVIGACILANNRGLSIKSKTKKIFLPLKFIASISYPLYLLHQNIGYAVMERLRPIITESEWIIVIAFLIVVFLAYFVHVFVERPTLKKLGH